MGNLGDPLPRALLKAELLTQVHRPDLVMLPKLLVLVQLRIVKAPEQLHPLHPAPSSRAVLLQVSPPAQSITNSRKCAERALALPNAKDISRSSAGNGTLIRILRTSRAQKQCFSICSRAKIGSWQSIRM